MNFLVTGIIFVSGAYSLRVDPESGYDSDLPMVDLSAHTEKFGFNRVIEEPGNVDAWLIMGHGGQTLEKNMYMPILLTLKAGLAGAGKTVQLVDAEKSVGVPGHVREGVSKGKKPLVFLVAFWFAGAKNPNIRQTIQDCASAGAHVVFYQTEPTNHGRDGPARMLQDAYDLQATEIWEYCYENMDAYPKDTRGVAVRYVPSGYLAELADIASVDLNSADRQEDKLGFMGGLRYREETVSGKAFVQKFRSLLGDKLVEAYDVWTPLEHARWVEKYPLQLNMAKVQTCCPRTNAPGINVFRISLLLSFKACVMSLPVNQQDTKNFESLVRFAEVEQTVDIMNDIRSAGIRECQSTSFARFKEEFDPTHLLDKTGVLALITQ